jgi:phage terminase large subunit-like protein
MTNCKEIDDYITLVRGGEYPCCKWQLLLCDFVERVFAEEALYIDTEQLAKYLSYEKYFPFALFPWEKFCFALHNCVYCPDGTLRFPQLVIYVGRGAGKNGYLGFEDFCLLTPANGVQEYNIDIYATSEDQAKQSWSDVYNVLEAHAVKMKKHFRWTLECITNLDTNSRFRFRTSAPKTKDGGRPGKNDFDEYHAYEDYKLIEVAETGLGKRKYGRETITTTDGDIRGGPLDDLLSAGYAVLEGDEPDGGTLYFLCSLDADEEADDERMWHKANPSLRYLPDLLHQMRLEYTKYKRNPAANTAFIKKRMNRPPKIRENGAASWEDILATNQEIPEADLIGRPCVIGIDYMKTTDFLGAGLLWRVGDRDIWLSHTWVCTQSPDLRRIKAPLREWEARGLLTFVDAAEIPPELPCVWLANEAAKRNAPMLLAGIDDYRFALLRNALEDISFYADKTHKNVFLIRPRDEMRRVPLITSGFVGHRFIWGDSPVMRWMTNNAKTVTSPSGNITYGKIEPKSRKTDTFKAFVAAECVSDVLDSYAAVQTAAPIEAGVFVFD